LDAFFTHSFTNLGLFIKKDPLLGAREICWTLKPDGTSAITNLKAHVFVDLLQRISYIVRPGKPITRVLANKFTSEEKLRETLIMTGFQKQRC
jgi:hypothetical protein